jgi:hypothetical protein
VQAQPGGFVARLDVKQDVMKPAIERLRLHMEAACLGCCRGCQDDVLGPLASLAKALIAARVRRPSHDEATTLATGLLVIATISTTTCAATQQRSWRPMVGVVNRSWPIRSARACVFVCELCSFDLVHVCRPATFCYHRSRFTWRGASQILSLGRRKLTPSTSRCYAARSASSLPRCQTKTREAPLRPSWHPRSETLLLIFVACAAPRSLGR